MHRLKNGKLSRLAFFFLFALISIVVTRTIVIDLDNKERENLLVQARFIANAINIKNLTKLNAKKIDVNLPAYQELKEQLKKIRLSNKKCKFLYLLEEKSSGEIFFFVDSQANDSKDYAEPGLIYNEVPDSYLQVFELKTESVVGPITDRWGTLITALVPLKDSNNKLIAMLGMDVEVKSWYQKIIILSLLPVSLFSLIIVLILLIIKLRQKTKELNYATQKAQFLSMHDPLTKLPNRRYCTEYFDNILAQAKRDNVKIAVLYIDLDDFKSINDNINHQAGDKVLVSLSKRLNQLRRKNEFIARIGGDEFCMIVYNYKDKEELKNIVNRLIDKSQNHITVANKQISFGMSIGIAKYPEDAKTYNELLQIADAAMYNAKNNKKGSYIL
jgi:diguanylate cyclase (GGDEF)-like protein